MKLFHSYNTFNKVNARALRMEMTEAEKLLWSKIRRKQICNIQFNRQMPIANYIVDFYASSAKLVIEIDGGQHFEDEHILRDQKRDKHLRELGIVVLRFDNSQVIKELDAVLDVIFREVCNSLNPPASTNALQLKLQSQSLSCPL